MLQVLQEEGGPNRTSLLHCASVHPLICPGVWRLRVIPKASEVEPVGQV